MVSSIRALRRPECLYALPARERFECLSRSLSYIYGHCIFRMTKNEQRYWAFANDGYTLPAAAFKSFRSRTGLRA